MPRIFITAFEPYGPWPENSSWLALVEFTKNLPSHCKITTRRYPVDFRAVRERLERDLSDGYDFALHLGQAPGSARIALEAVGINIGQQHTGAGAVCQPLVDEGPVAYRSSLPLDRWAESLRRAGIPAHVSFHAGTYLCNATLYWSHHIASQRGLPTRACFVHLPLDVSQCAKQEGEIAGLPSTLAAQALRLIVDDLVENSQTSVA